MAPKLQTRMQTHDQRESLKASHSRESRTKTHLPSKQSVDGSNPSGGVSYFGASQPSAAADRTQPDAALSRADRAQTSVIATLFRLLFKLG